MSVKFVNYGFCTDKQIDVIENQNSGYFRSQSKIINYKLGCILCLISRTTVTSARNPEEDACHRALNLCVFSRVQKGTPGLTHKGCVLQRVSLGALSDVMVVLGMRQSLDPCGTPK